MCLRVAHVPERARVIRFDPVLLQSRAQSSPSSPALRSVVGPTADRRAGELWAPLGSRLVLLRLPRALRNLAG